MKKIKYVFGIFWSSGQYILIKSVLTIVTVLILMTILGLILESKTFVTVTGYKIRDAETGLCNVQNITSCFIYWFYSIFVIYAVVFYLVISKASSRNSETNTTLKCDMISMYRILITISGIIVVVFLFFIGISYLGLIISTYVYNLKLPYICHNRSDDVSKYICNNISKDLRVLQCEKAIDITFIWNYDIEETADFNLHRLSCLMSGFISILLIGIIILIPILIVKAYKRCKLEVLYLRNDVMLSQIKVEH